MTTSEDQTPVSTDGQLLDEIEKLRTRNEELRRQLAERKPPAGSPWWRNRWLSVAAAVLTAILLPVAVHTVWARNTLLDTNQYVDTVAPLAENEDVQEAVTFRVTEAVSEAVNFRGLAEEALPPEADILAGPIEAGAETLISELVGEVVASDGFARLWEDTNREAHGALVPLVKGESSDIVDTEGGRVAVNLGPVAEGAVGRLDERLGTDFANQIPSEALDDAEVVLVESEELADAQTLARWLDRIAWFSLILALAFAVAVVVLAERRRLGVRRLGVAIVIPMVLTLVAIAWARSQYAANLPEGVHNPDAAIAVFDILTNFLRRALRALLVVGLLVLLGAWVVGPSVSAGRVWRSWETLVGRAGESGAGRDVGPAVRWVGENARALQYGLAGLGALVLVLWTRPTGLVIVLIVIVTLIAIGGVRLIAEVASRAVAGQPSVDVEETVDSG